jgi:hypothetical protein
MDLRNYAFRDCCEETHVWDAMALSLFLADLLTRFIFFYIRVMHNT